MASTIDHEKPEAVDEPPAVKKVRLDEDAKVAEDVEKVKIDEGSPPSEEGEKGENGEDKAANEAEEKADKPDVAGSAFGGFAAFSGSSGFGAFAAAGSGASGFGAFASKTGDADGFGVKASSSSSGFGATASPSASTSASTSPAASSSATDKEASDKPSGFGGFASFQSTSTFSSFASKATETDGFGTTAESSDLSDIDAAAAAEKKPEVVVPALTEAELANGEEGETILIEKRAKLYKLVDNDYTEVGIGPLRVLRAKDADTDDKSAARFVMRRESYPRGPGTKLLVNASLSSCLTCVKKTEKALMVTVLEPSEEEGREFAPSTYLLRFGAPEDMDAVHARLARYIAADK